MMHFCLKPRFHYENKQSELKRITYEGLFLKETNESILGSGFLKHKEQFVKYIIISNK